MILTRLAHALAAGRAFIALALVATLMAGCGNSGSFFGTLPRASAFSMRSSTAARSI
jgi:hypothetical protein